VARQLEHIVSIAGFAGHCAEMMGKLIGRAKMFAVTVATDGVGMVPDHEAAWF
jgi:hypothetical protein